MGRKNFNAYIKKQKEQLKKKKKEEKRKLKEERKSQATSGKLEDMTAYIDEDGNIVSKLPKDGEIDSSDAGPDDSKET